MVKTIQEFCLGFSLIKEQTYRFFVMVEAHSDEEIHTPAILEDFLPDHDRTMTDSRPKTHLTDRLSSMSNFLFPIKGSGGSNLRSFSAQKKTETAVMNSVRRNC
jgi:hypothetical protein